MSVAVPLNKAFLLKTAQSENISDVEELKLNNLSLKNEDLLPNTFNMFNQLIELDLSHNSLTQIPEGIVLPKLQYLDISHNCIEDVTWIERFSDLIELDIQGNFELTIDDRYKVIFTLKKLQYLDEKRIENREKFCSQYTKGILLQLENIWKSSKYPENLKNCTSSEMVEAFVEVAKQKVKYGPSSLKLYRQWRVEKLVQEFVDFKVNCPVQNIWDSYVESMEENSLSPKSMKQKIDKQNELQSPKRLKLSPNTDMDYVALNAIQCHSKSDGCNDFSTQVWCCVFEPDKNNQAKTTNIVATCGGDTVCLIDCDTLKVQSKFYQANEEFFTLAWTTLQIVKQKSNFLAAAGCLGFIHLIHPDQDICYGRIKIHSSPVQTLIFSPSGKTHLLSADRKGHVFLTNIDIPTIPEYKFSWKKLMTFEGVDSTPLKLLVPDNGIHLMCATEFGLYCWQTKGFVKHNSNTVTSPVEITFPFVNADVRLVDALSMLTDDVVASKCAQQGSIFLWRFSDIKERISKAVKSKNKKVTAKIAVELKWSVTKQCYLNLACCPKLKSIAAGDEKGNLWLYDATIPLKEKRTSECPIPEAIVNPVNVVLFPNCVGASGTKISELRSGSIFNDVACSYDMKYIAVAADNNLVCIYKKA